jgi:anti-sigma factor RsiW
LFNESFSKAAEVSGTGEEADLHGWVDAQLDETRAAEWEAHMSQHPDDAEKVRAYRQLNEGLRAMFAPVLEEPVPERLLKRPRGWRWFVAAYGRAAALVVISFAAGWFARPYLLAPQAAFFTFPRQAATAHVVYVPEVRHPVEVSAKEQDHLVRWLSKRLGTDLKCPVLSSFGYELVGGRLLSGPSGPVAHFMFQDSRGVRLTLYVSGQRSDPRETAFRYSREDNVSVFYWIDGKFGYALSGEMGREQLLSIANTVYQQLNQ